ncbi:MAG: ATP-binding protein [Candidatus Omnitrophica bacterium]|nr:ATP-binding protein [Candidatus Omnitrophota bacterium]
MKRYIHRAIEKELLKAAKEFPVIVLTGPRQTGKSTVLQNIFPKHNYTTFDDPLTSKLANDDPKFFLSRAKKMVVDEIQYVPSLLPFIKMAVDSDRRNAGHFILTGSQYFTLMGGISESLAGRAALYELLPFSSEEISHCPGDDGMRQSFSAMFHGFFPEIVAHGVDRNRFYTSYLQTYLERDIRQITSVHDLKIFQNFLELLAARAGNILNIHELSKEAGVSFTSARRWISILESTRLIYLLRPFTKNITKRVIKSPKLYFTDTGLLAYLLRYPNAATMSAGPQAGAFFENLILAEILKLKYNHNLNFEPYFYRDSNHNEIDFVLDYGVAIKMFEVKCLSTPNEKHFASLKKAVKEVRNSYGYLVSFAKERMPAAKNIESIPWSFVKDVAYNYKKR